MMKVLVTVMIMIMMVMAIDDGDCSDGDCDDGFWSVVSDGDGVLMVALWQGSLDMTKRRPDDDVNKTKFEDDLQKCITKTCALHHHHHHNHHNKVTN